MFLEIFSRQDESPRAPQAIVRRFILWTIVCWASAAPSFGFALSIGRTGSSARTSGAGFDPWAMAAAITLFSLLYTFLTSTDAFARFHRIRGMRRTLYIGYWTRIALSIAFPITILVDVLTGVLSVEAVARVLGSESGFAATFLITCVHGAIMNLLIALYMAILFPIVRACTRDPLLRPGFEVVLPQATIAEKSRPQ